MIDGNGKTVVIDIPLCISVPLERYEELIKNEAALNTIANMYRNSESFSYDYVFKAIFGDKTGEKGAD